MERILTNKLKYNVGKTVFLEGWIHNLRRLGDINFLIIRDRGGLAQAVMSVEDLKPVEGLQLGTVVSLEGTVVTAPQAPGGVELHDSKIEVITPVIEPLPLPINKTKLKANQQFFLDHAVVGHRHPRQQALFRLSAGIMRGFRETLHSKDFVEIQTPKLVASATESGANLFGVEYFGRTAFLAQSPQFYKQIMVGVFERVYEVAPVFRAEKHATGRHLNEYVSLDLEMGFIKDHYDVTALLTELLHGVLNLVKDEYAEDIDLLNVQWPALNKSIPHIHIVDAQQLLAEKYGVTDAVGEPDLTPRHETLLGEWAKEKYKSDYLFVTGYPMSKRPFYTHPDHDRPGYSNGFDLLFRGLELVTGGQRLHKYEDYIDAATKYGYHIEPFETYFEAFKHGMPPHGGFAIGLERFLMQLLDIDNIRMATLFPRDRNRLTP